MSGGLKVLQMDELDVSRLLTATTHIGSTNVNYQMQQYVFKRRPDGVNIVDLRKTYEKLLLAARAIAAIENPSDVFVISSRPMGQRAVLKYARYTGATPIAGRFTPGAFTNQIQAAFREPRLLVVTDPLQDHQPVNEASYVNIPVLAFANTDSPLKYVDISIPCNNKSAHSVGLMWWMLAREVLRLRGTISRSVPWEEEVMPDLFFYRDADEQEKEETARQEEVAKPEPIAEEAATEEAATEEVAGSGAPATLQQMITTDPSRIAGAPADEKPATNWAGEAAAPSDWAAQPTGTSENWGGDSTSWA